jgi:DNA-directed RNA polymerase alpha subunit
LIAFIANWPPVIGDTLERMTKGDKDILAISGFGRKSLADLKRSLRKRGYEIPEAAEQTDI